MSINKLIIDTLESTGVPVDFQTYEGDENKYITFSEYLQQGEGFADDDEIVTGHYIQINVWSKYILDTNTSYRKIVDQVKKLLKEKGFIRKYETELYEPDTKIFHKVLRFFYYVENEEDE